MQAAIHVFRENSNNSAYDEVAHDVKEENDNLSGGKGAFDPFKHSRIPFCMADNSVDHKHVMYEKVKDIIIHIIIPYISNSVKGWMGQIMTK